MIEIGGAAVPKLIETLKDNDPSIRCSAALALGRIGPPAAAAFPALVEMTGDDSVRVRSDACLALIRVDRDNTEVIAVLRRLLSDQDASIRSQVIDSVAEFGSLGVPILIEGLSLDDKGSRTQVVKTLGTSG